MNEFLYRSPAPQAELDARRERVRADVASSRRHDTPTGSRPHGGLAALAALLGAQPRHRAA